MSGEGGVVSLSKRQEGPTSSFTLFCGVVNSCVFDVSICSHCMLLYFESVSCFLLNFCSNYSLFEWSGCALWRLFVSVFTPFRPTLTSVRRFCNCSGKTQKGFLSLIQKTSEACKFDAQVRPCPSKKKCVVCLSLSFFTRRRGLTFTSAHVLVRAPIDGPGSQLTLPLATLPQHVCRRRDTGLSPLVSNSHAPPSPNASHPVPGAFHSCFTPRQAA